MKKECSRCINDTTVRRIKFNEKGICNFCLGYDEIQEKLNDKKLLEKLFLDRINKVKGKYKYDAVVGFSGGKDSAYVLYQLIHKYKLKVKAFTLNNGFLTEEAINKIDEMVKELNVEHEYIECPIDFLSDMYNYSMKKVFVPCIMCSYLGYSAMVNYASKEDAGMSIHGRSTPQMFRTYANDFADTFKPYIEAGLKPIDEVNLKEMYESVLEKVGRLIDPKIQQTIEEVLLPDIKKNGYREFVPYFLYHDYDEKEVVEFIEKHTGWFKEDKSKVNHFDCAIHHAAKYINQCIQKRPHCMPEISVLIREGKINKNTAKKMLQSEVMEHSPDDEIKILCDFAKLNKSFHMGKVKLISKRWW